MCDSSIKEQMPVLGNPDSPPATAEDFRHGRKPTVNKWGISSIQKD